LGETGIKYHCHETALLKSPKFAYEIAKARAKARKTQHQNILLNLHDPAAFEQMLQFLYTEHFTLLRPTAAEARCKEFYNLMGLARHYQLPDLQKLVVSCFQKSKILGKIKPEEFFKWAEDMWYEEIDHETGSFRGLFMRVAPGLLRGAQPDVFEGLMVMVSCGGGFAEALLRACSAVRGILFRLVLP